MNNLYRKNCYHAIEFGCDGGQECYCRHREEQDILNKACRMNTLSKAMLTAGLFALALVAIVEWVT